VRGGLQRALQIGVESAHGVDVAKRIRLCNLIALTGCLIMGPWLAVEAAVGERANMSWEMAFLASFLAVLTLNAVRAHRAARLLLLITANVCVFVGAVMFEERAGGALPFLALVGMPLMLFGPREKSLLAVGVGLPALLFAAYQTGAAARWLALDVRAAPPWYLAANAVAAFAATFVMTFFFYWSNLRAEAGLERMGQEKLKRVIDSNLIGVARGTLSGHVEEANDAFLDLLGYTRQDLRSGAIDQSRLAVIDPLDPTCTRTLDELRQRGSSSVRERTFIRKDGSLVPVLVGVSFLDERHDEVVGFVLDITAQKHMEAQKTMLRESQEALRLRDLFDSIASHELRTPLTALTMGLQLLRRGLERELPTGSTLKRQAERCEYSAVRMKELAQALLDVAQIHDGKLRLSASEVDLVEGVRKVVDGLEGSDLCACSPIEIDAPVPVTARVDSLRFGQVVTNLLSNAVKYGAGQPVELHLSEDRGRDVARLEVIDHGPGIEPCMLARIFQPFQRAVRADAPIPGLGLGLYVVKMIVESHGGSVQVESQLGQGSRFIVELPRAAGRLA
jgi:PAS domain S-box-containing protein